MVFAGNMLVGGGILSVIVGVNGIGCSGNIPSTTKYELFSIGMYVKLRTYAVSRKGCWASYVFLTFERRDTSKLIDECGMMEIIISAAFNS
ncbi:MAG: hypothetical protein LBR91_02195 [Puniceicoccales bacterium]|nr:hypothetical protein [Puniceicoccales bacterium]